MLFGDDLDMVKSKIDSCKNEQDKEGWKNFKADFAKDMGTGQHVCYRVNRYEI
jgi:hypothetical protein